MMAANKTGLRDIEALRRLFLHESHHQVRYEACHERGWTDSYLLVRDDIRIGYGSVRGQDTADRDTVFEFFVLPSFRDESGLFFRELLAASGARYIECQTNDRLLCPLLFEFAQDISATAVLFEDHVVTQHAIADAVARRRRKDDRIFKHEREPVGDHVLARGEEIVATGGFMLHYNAPFADLYLEVRQDCRGRGYGSFLLQELKRECYLAGRVPAARCDLDNAASRRTLAKSGFGECGFMAIGKARIPK
jgi:GNAT superfamily N-acetyltransferase